MASTSAVMDPGIRVTGEHGASHAAPLARCIYGQIVSVMVTHYARNEGKRMQRLSVSLHLCMTALTAAASTHTALPV